MKRREFIAGLGAAAFPVVVGAQAVMPVVGVLLIFNENDLDAKTMLSLFVKRLEESGWEDGRNVRIEFRWTSGNVDLINKFARELVELHPRVILVGGDITTAAIQRITRAIPVVFVNVSDPVGYGFVASLPHPGGNLTGFGNQEASLGGKWLELLTQIAPGVRRAAIMFNSDTASGGGSYYMPSF